MYGKSDLKKVKGISGHLIDIKGTATLPIKIGKHLFYQKFYIFDEILHSLLLEIDFLKANNCTLNFKSQTIDTEGEPVVNTIEPDFKLGLARPVQNTVIPPNSETVIPIKVSKVPHQTTVLFEPVMSQHVPNNCLSSNSPDFYTMYIAVCAAGNAWRPTNMFYYSLHVARLFLANKV